RFFKPRYLNGYDGRFLRFGAPLLFTYCSLKSCTGGAIDADTDCTTLVGRAMIEVPPTPVLGQCPRCRGRLLKGEEHNEYSCLFCGEYLFHREPQAEPPPLIREGPRRRGRPRKPPVAV